MVARTGGRRVRRAAAEGDAQGRRAHLPVAGAVILEHVTTPGGLPLKTSVGYAPFSENVRSIDEVFGRRCLDVRDQGRALAYSAGAGTGRLSGPPGPYAGSVRLAKFLAHVGAASRRGRGPIAQGRVGAEVVTDPARDVDESSAVSVDGQASSPEPREVHALNKPAWVVSTARDTHGRPTVVELVRSRRRLYPVGRLDADTTGLAALADAGLRAGCSPCNAHRHVSWTGVARASPQEGVVMDEHPNVALIREMFAAMERGDVQWLEDHTADDIVWHTGGNSRAAGVRRGKDEVRELMAAAVNPDAMRRRSMPSSATTTTRSSSAPRS